MPHAYNHQIAEQTLAEIFAVRPNSGLTTSHVLAEMRNRPFDQVRINGSNWRYARVTDKQNNEVVVAYDLLFKIATEIIMPHQHSHPALGVLVEEFETAAALCISHKLFRTLPTCIVKLALEHLGIDYLRTSGTMQAKMCYTKKSDLKTVLVVCKGPQNSKLRFGGAHRLEGSIVATPS